MTINTDGGAYISGIVNAPTFIGRDQFNYYFSGLAPLVHDPIRRFRNFLNEYLGTPDHSVPFGGRQTQIEELDNWFNDPSTPPYYLMVAEAGRGKSALVCRWIEQLRQQRNDVEVVFIPISIRFETATQDVVFAALAARLAKLHNEPLNPVALSGKQWQGVCESYVDRSLLDALSAALGPLTLDDLAELAPEFQSSRLVRTLLKFVERWVIGNGKEQGYVFSHSRLGYYFWEQLNHQEQVDWDRRLCDWGAYTLEKLNTDQLDPKDTSVYLLRYYVAHLQRSNAPTEAFYALVSNGWRKAWECLDISYSGFFNDLEQAWSAAVLEGISALGQLIRTALFMSSAITVNTNMRDDLLVSCLDAKVITPTNALALARCKTDINERIATLLAVSKHLPVDLQKTALVEALTNIREIADKDNRLDELAKLAAHLTSDVSDVAEKVWMILNEDSFPRAMMLGEWARKLPPDQQRPIFIEALNTVSTINNKGEYFAALLYIARCITPVTNDFSEKILAMAQTIYQKSNDSRTYVEVLCVVADEVNADRKFGILQSALEIARAVAFEGIRISSLGIISSRLPAWQQVSVLQEMLVVARSIPNEFIRAEELTVIATYTPPQLAEIINLILTEAHNIANETIRFKVLTHIVHHFQISDEELIHEILRLDRTGYIESEQGDGLTKIIDLLPLDASLLLEKVYHTIRTFSARDVRASLLARLAQRLSSTNAELLQKIFDDIRSIDWSSERIKALVTISKQVPPDEKQNLIDEVLTLAFNNPDSYYPDHKCKLKDPQCHSEAVFCRRICGSTPEILRIQPLRMTQPLLKFTLMLPRHTVYSNR